ncbi:hypothetical protein Pta02_05570 [Planobispora takensis]|uniref:Uncharacterized protein n=2 Tax=Planobispora TaxID=29298 RepID=A0A8J3SZW1_9ACTN|nr:hypothetical protein Psi01_27650 [Planobispora siamensis]GIH98548.1 hypothetical protein Pta02_05570 [Planobispora takensis]
MSAVERGNGHVGIPPDGHRPERPVGHEGLGGHINGTLSLPRGFTLFRFIRGHDPVVSSPGGLLGKLAIVCRRKFRTHTLSMQISLYRRGTITDWQRPPG